MDTDINNFSFIHHFLFSWGYFLVFLGIFYKYFFPILYKMIINHIVDKNNKSNNLLTNLEDYKKQYKSYEIYIQQLNNNITKLQEEKIILEKACQLKYKTLSYNYHSILEKKKLSLIKFYKQMALDKWLAKNQNLIVQELRKYNYNYDVDFTLPEKTVDTEKLSIDIFKKIDDLWS